MKTCPKCGTNVPYQEGYLPWCECGWNLFQIPPDWEDDQKKLKNIELGENIFSKLQAHDTSKQPLKFNIFISNLVTLTMGLIVVVCLILYIDFDVHLLLIPFFVAKILGGILALGLWLEWEVLFFNTRRKRIRQREAPLLFEELDRFCHAIKVPKVSAVAFTKSANFPVRVEQPLVAGSKTLVISLPMMWAMRPNEFAILLARELLLHQMQRRFMDRIARFALGSLNQVYMVFSSEASMSQKEQKEENTIQNLRNMKKQANLRLVRSLLFPLSVIPYLMIQIMNKQIFVREQNYVYKVNEQIAIMFDSYAIKKGLIATAVHNSISYSVNSLQEDVSLSSIKEVVQLKVSQTPLRELERLWRTEGEEVTSQRPLLRLQLAQLDRHPHSGEGNSISLMGAALVSQIDALSV